MRVLINQGPLTVHGVSGTFVVLLGMSMPPEACENLAGFAVERTDHTQGGRASWMLGLKAFSATSDRGRVDGRFSTRHHPIQSFTCSEYAARPGSEYTYRVVALKGAPHALEEFAEAS